MLILEIDTKYLWLTAYVLLLVWVLFKPVKLNNGKQTTLLKDAIIGLKQILKGE